MPEDSSFWVGPPTEPDTYQLVDMLGSGGEGQVWRAVLPLSEAGRRNVAVKILSYSAWPDEQSWTQFGHLLLSLSHPGLVRVTAVFSGPGMHRHRQTPPADHQRYVVMDFIEGITISEWLAENPDATASARIGMLRTVASALDEMHSGRNTEVPVAHGDVKPANIIVRPDGGAVLVDLGLIRLSDGAGVPGRTNPYAAPELHQDGAHATPEADAFAFVATLAHLLIGQAPPLDADRRIDMPALENLLTSGPVTQRRPALVRQVLTALTAAAGDRPRELGSWLASTSDTVSQVTSHVIPAVTPAPQAPASTNIDPNLEPGKKRSRGKIGAVVAAIAVVLLGGSYLAGSLTHPIGGDTAAVSQTLTTTALATTTIPAGTLTVTKSPTTIASAPGTTTAGAPATTGGTSTGSATNLALSSSATSQAEAGTQYLGNIPIKDISRTGETGFRTTSIVIADTPYKYSIPFYATCLTDDPAGIYWQEYDLGGSWNRFTATFGTTDTSTRDPVDWKLIGDGAVLAQGTSSKGNPQKIDTPITGVQSLRLQVFNVAATTSTCSTDTVVPVWGDAELHP